MEHYSLQLKLKIVWLKGLEWLLISPR